MKSYTTKQIKNIALLGNAGSGKTTVAETMLFEAGAIDRRGDVDAKNTVSDHHQIEQENQTSMYSTVMHAEYNNKKLNILDVPGADDFVGGTVSSLHVVDSGVLVINAQNGVEVGTEIHSRYLDKFNKPAIVLINKCDHDQANFEKAFESVKDSLGGDAVLAQYPVNAGPGFDTLIDIILFKQFKYPKDGGKPEITDIPESEADRAEELRQELIEKAAENDEALMELFFENDGLTEDEMRSGITAGVVARGMYPVFCASGKNNMGVGRFMEFLTNVAPSYDEMPTVTTAEGEEVKRDEKGPTSIFIFKTSVESHIGEINYFKVVSGTLKEGDDLVNNSTRNKERLSQIFAGQGKGREKVTSLAAGDIGCTVKMKATKTNNTLTSPDVSYEFGNIPFPEPKFRTAIKTLVEGDEEKLGEALNRMHRKIQQF